MSRVFRSMEEMPSKSWTMCGETVWSREGVWVSERYYMGKACMRNADWRGCVGVP